jgi:hypothetical protein
MRPHVHTAALALTVLIVLAQPMSVEAQTSFDRPDPTTTDARRMTELAGSTLGPAASVYLAPAQSPSGSVLPRWRTGEDGSSRTVTVHFQRPEDPVKHGAGYRWAVNQAISQWTAIPGVALRFQEAAGPETAQVTFKWVPQLSADHSGLTEWVTDTNGWIAKATVTLTLLGANGRPVDRDFARRVALHEIGHLIGLPHSGDESDMMFPTSEQTRISQRDRDTARLLYALEPWTLLDDE